jgi:hypothetical protein
VGMVLCHFGLVRRLALKLHRRHTSSADKFQNSENTRPLATRV